MADEASVAEVVEDVAAAFAVAEPEEGVIGEPMGVGEAIGPRGRGFADEPVGGAGGGIGLDEFEPALLAILDGEDEHTVGRPTDACDEDVFVGVAAEIDGDAVAGFGIGDGERDGGVGLAGLGIACLLGGAVEREEVDDGVERNCGAIEREVGDVLVVVAPPVGGPVAAAVEFFLINPIEDGMAADLVAVGGERADFAVGDVEHVEVVVGDEGDVAGGWGEGGEATAGEFGELDEFVLFEVVDQGALLMDHEDLAVVVGVVDGSQCEAGGGVVGDVGVFAEGGDDGVPIVGGGGFVGVGVDLHEATALSL